jgi:hypothetical protein
MQATLDFDTLTLLVVFVLPGLVSMQVYRLLMPAKEVSWKEATLEAFFYSSFNFAVLFPLVYLYASGGATAWWSAWLVVLAVVFVGPVVWPVLVVLVFRSEWIGRIIKIPYPTPWDYFFSRGESVYVLVYLKTGEVIAGVWSDESNAGQHEHVGDLYLQAQLKMDSDGTLGDVVPLGKGVLIRRDEYSYIELFEVPPALPRQPEQDDTDA